MRLRAIIGHADARILVLGGLALLAVLFSGYKAISSLSGSQSAPNYQKSPPSAFAVPLAETIVDPQKLTAPRLPDEAYEQIDSETNKLSVLIARGKLTAKDLQADGMSRVEAIATAKQVASIAQAFAGRNTKLEGGATLTSVTPTSAESTQTIDFGTGAGGAPGGSFTVDFQFATSGNPTDWSVSSVDINLSS